MACTKKFEFYLKAADGTKLVLCKEEDDTITVKLKDSGGSLLGSANYTKSDLATLIAEYSADVT